MAIRESDSGVPLADVRKGKAQQSRRNGKVCSC